MGQTTCRVFIGLSLDGYIADKGGGLDWLDRVPNPSGSDFGYADRAICAERCVGRCAIPGDGTRRLGRDRQTRRASCRG